MASESRPVPQFEAPYAADDGAIAAMLLAAAGLSAEQDSRIDRTATRLIGAIRTHDDRLGGVEDMLREFALSTKEGLALMVLAEALLRVPDARTADQSRVHFAGAAPAGNYVAPHIFELSSADQLTEEVFGPVLHVERYPADRLDDVLQSIERSGYGLTLGIHSRIDDTVEAVIERLAVGNIYVNRNMIGAVVGGGGRQRGAAICR